MEREDIKAKNRLVFSLLSEYINLYPDAISPELIRETRESCNVGTEDAFRILVAGILDVYDDRELRRGWFSKMFRCLDREAYENDPYRRAVTLPGVKDGEWELGCDSYKPYEAFVFNDPSVDSEGRIIPQIGFFEESFSFPVVRQGGREWMLITPNEIETMRAPIAAARGKVVTYGLGLGYFAFMISIKESVTSVTVVEKDRSVIELFKKHILPQFKEKDKICIICADAFEYARSEREGDFVFADIWHDPSDGCSAYLRLKALEREGAEYAYWIEDTIKLYL